jgi:hypothetical protein
LIIEGSIFLPIFTSVSSLITIKSFFKVTGLIAHPEMKKMRIIKMQDTGCSMQDLKKQDAKFRFLS